MINNFITGVSNRVANYCGFGSSKEGFTRLHTDKMIDRVIGGGESLSKYFFWQYFDEQSGIFFLEEDVAGFAFEISPIVGGSSDLVTQFDRFFNSEMPEGVFVQFLLVASHDVSPVLNLWKNGKKSLEHPIGKMTRKREDLMMSLAREYDVDDGRVLRDYRIFVNVSSKLSKTKKDDLNKFKRFKKSFKQLLRAGQLNPYDLSGEGLLRLVREIINVDFTKEQQDYFEISETKPLSEQVLKNLGRWKLEEDAFINETTGIASKYYKVDQFPQSSSLASMVKILGGRRIIPGRHIVSYTVASDVNAGKQSAILGRGAGASRAADMWINRGNAQIQRDAQEWVELQNEIKSDDTLQRFLTESFGILLSSRIEELDIAEQSLTDVYSEWSLSSDDSFHLPALLSILPLHQPLYWSLLKYVRQVGYTLGRQATAKLPIHAEWKGHNSSGVLFAGRNGQLFNWNPFESTANYNIVVFGTSGGGKSFFMQELAITMKSQNKQLFILDIGESFRNLCLVSKGESIKFGKGSSLCINPFSGFKRGMLELEDGRDAFLEVVKCTKEIISIMCGANSEVEMGELEKSIIHAVQQSNFNLDINGFVHYLQNSDNEMLKRFAVAMFTYTKEGIYGKYFNGEKSATFRRPITVFEFEEIKGDKKLLTIVLQALLMEITSQFLAGDRSKGFMIVVDEAYKLLDSEGKAVAKFFAELCRVVRKYGGSLVICVQNYSDLQQSNDHRAILANSTWSVIMKIDPKAINQFDDSDAFKHYKPLIKSLAMVPGKYSEMLISSSEINVVGRLIVDDYSASMYSTTREDYNYLTKAVEAGIDLDFAIETLVEQKNAAVEW